MTNPVQVLTLLAACSVLEPGHLHRVERAHGLPRAERQVRARGTLGVAYRDGAYGELLLELDGLLFHDSAEQRDIDLDRDLDAAVDRHVTVRLGYGRSSPSTSPLGPGPRPGPVPTPLGSPP